MVGVRVRMAGEADVEAVLEFIRKKAEFDRILGAFTGPLHATANAIREALFGSPVYAYSLLN